MELKNLLSKLRLWKFPVINNLNVWAVKYQKKTFRSLKLKLDIKVHLISSRCNQLSSPLGSRNIPKSYRDGEWFLKGLKCTLKHMRRDAIIDKTQSEINQGEKGCGWKSRFAQCFLFLSIFAFVGRYPCFRTVSFRSNSEFATEKTLEMLNNIHQIKFGIMFE